MARHRIEAVKGHSKTLNVVGCYTREAYKQAHPSPISPIQMTGDQGSSNDTVDRHQTIAKVRGRAHPKGSFCSQIIGRRPAT